MRWCRGSVAERVFAPWKECLEAAGVQLLGGRRALHVLPGQSGRRFRCSFSFGFGVWALPVFEV